MREHSTEKEKRDYGTEIASLLERYPELVGTTLPRAVVEAALNGESLADAYGAYLSRTLRSHAPVRGVSGSAAVQQRGEDDFLRGFNS